jgi:DNA-binding NarL/FixJ family response regulator
MIGSMETTLATVLVIESHPLMRAALSAAITEEPDLQLAEPGSEGATSFQMVVSSQHDVLLLANKPDVILLALGNPGLQELEVLKRLHVLLPDIPILALTSNEVDGQEQAALQAGANKVLIKAAPRAELIQALHELQMKTIMNHSQIRSEKEANEEISP